MEPRSKVSASEAFCLGYLVKVWSWGNWGGENWKAASTPNYLHVLLAWILLMVMKKDLQLLGDEAAGHQAGGSLGGVREIS